MAPEDFDLDRIDLGSTRATLIRSGKPAGRLNLAEVQELEIVELTLPDVADDECFFVLVTPARVWVIPEDANGLSPLLEHLVPRLAPQGRVFRVVSGHVPWRWRGGSGLRRSQRTRLGDHPLRTRPTWERAVLDGEDVLRMTGVGE